MNIQQAQPLIRKISFLLENADAQQGLSRIDRDLLLATIRQLYDLLLDENLTPAPEVPVIQVDVEVAKETEQPQSVVTPVIEPVEPEVVTQTTVAIPPVQEVVVAPVQPVAAPLPIVEKIVPPVVTPPTESALHGDAIHEIFAELTIRDLSDKLAMAPIADLTKAMGLNEKMLTQQELFGNNAQAFQEAMQALNNCRSFSEAKQYLIDHVAGTYQWTQENKVKKAANFVKLVRRRFL